MGRASVGARVWIEIVAELEQAVERARQFAAESSTVDALAADRIAASYGQRLSGVTGSIEPAVDSEEASDVSGSAVEPHQ